LLVAALALSATTLMVFRSKQQNKDSVPAGILKAFSEWKSIQNKAYKSPAEHSFRLAVFYQNFLKIQRHSDHSYTVALNVFADLTEEEFLAKYTGLKTQPRENKVTIDRPVMVGAPTEVDWRTQGAVNQVKNQGQCGSCWAFSAIGAFESAAKIAGYALYSMSEQQLVDCSTGEGNQGCNGGWMDYAFQYIQRVGGIMSESDYPYKAVDQQCKAVTEKFQPPKVDSWVDVGKNKCDELLDAVSKQPVAVAVAANAMQFYSSGIFSNRFCGTGLNHGVVAVGYGHDASSKKDFWIVRNSWGGAWGEKGYIRMDRAIQPTTGICGICMAASYPVVKKN